MNLSVTQVEDALRIMKALEAEGKSAPTEPSWGEGLRLILLNVIPLKCDYQGDDVTYAWLEANDFNGYDLRTDEP